MQINIITSNVHAALVERIFRVHWLLCNPSSDVIVFLRIRWGLYCLIARVALGAT